MRQTIGVLLVVLLCGGTALGNDIASSTMHFFGMLTDNGDGTYSGVLPMLDEGGSASGYDIYALEGGTAQFGNDPGSGPVWTSQAIAADHDGWPSDTPDTPDWYQYSLRLWEDGGVQRWAVRNHPGGTAANPWFDEVYWGPNGLPACGVPMSGVMTWESMFAAETDVGAYLPGTGTSEIPGGAVAHGGGAGAWDMDWSWGSEVVPLQFPGFAVAVEDLGGGNYRVTLEPAAPSEVWVDDDFDSSTPGWGVTHFDKIQDGIDAVGGSTVHVGPGTYTEALLIEKEITLLGATAGVNKNGYTVPAGYAWDDTVETIINHPDPAGGYLTIVDIHDTDNVTFDGFIVQELNAVANNNSSLLRVYAHSREITNVRVVNNIIGPNTNTTSQDGAQGRMGLYIVNHPYNDNGIVNSTFAGNKIFDCKGNGDNVFIWSSYYAYGAVGPASMAGTVIEDNEIYGSHRAGIETAGGFKDLTIRNNRIYGNSGLPGDDPDFLKYGHGIMMIRGSSDKVSNPLTAYGPVDLVIEGNEIFDNEKNGIYIGPKNEGITITGNVIHDNGWDGVMLDLAGNYWNPTFENPPVSEQYACYDCSTDVVAVDNAIFNNGVAAHTLAHYGVQVNGEPTNGFVFDASANWWGDSTPTGVAAKVSANVDYTPWMANDGLYTASGFLGDYSELWVDDDSPQAGALGYIGEALDLVSGSTVHVAPGIYEEQVHITDDGLHLIGSGFGDDPMVDTIIQSPTALAWYYETSNKNYPIVGVDGATGVEISNVRIDGLARGSDNYRFQGLAFWNSDGALTDCVIDRVRDATFSGAQHGVGIYAFNDDGGPHTVAITRTTITDYQKTGMALNGTGLTAHVTDCVTVGHGATDVTAQNGIQFWGAAGGTITGCNISGNMYYPPAGQQNWAATGVLLMEAGTVDVQDTVCTDNDPAFMYQDTNGSLDGVSVVNNDAESGGGVSVKVYNAMKLGVKADEESKIMPQAPPAPFGDGELGASSKDRGDLSLQITNSDFSGNTVRYGITGSSYLAGTDIAIEMSHCVVADWGWAFVAYSNGGEVAFEAHENAVTGLGGAAYAFDTLTAEQDFSGNYFGGIAADDMPGYFSSNIDYAPWMPHDGTYNSPGFDGDFTDLWVDDDSAQTGGVARIQEAIDLVSNGTVNVAAGEYVETATLLPGHSYVLAGAGADAVTWTVPTEDGACVACSLSGQTAATDIEISGFTFNARPNATLVHGTGIKVFRASAGPLSLRIHDNRFIEDRVSGDDDHWGTSMWLCHNRYAARDGGEAPVKIYDNIDSTWGGITMSNSQGYDVYNNVFAGCSDAIYNGHGCPDVAGQTFGDHHIYGNVFKNATDRLHPGGSAPAIDWQYYGSGGGTHLPSVIENNLFQHNDKALRFIMETDMVYPAHIVRHNQFIENGEAMIVRGDFATPVNAEYNFWGSAEGPADGVGADEIDLATCGTVPVNDMLNDAPAGGLGDPVTDNVDYCPWDTACPRLMLTPDAACYLGGDTITVVLSMHDIAELIRGGQFFLEYDASKLTFVSAVPSAAFPAEVEEIVDEIAGTIVYAVGVGVMGGTPVTGDAEMATLTFEAIGPLCELPGVIDWMPHTPPTRLTDAYGDPVYSALINMDIIDEAGPVIDCPADVTVECDAVPLAGMPSVTDNCDPDPDIVYDGEVQIDGTCPDSYTLERTWTAIDHCGNVSTCTQTITVVDTTPPTITTLAADETVECDGSGNPAALAAWLDAHGGAVATDNCGDITWSYLPDPAELSDLCGATGAVSVTFYATDDCGLSSETTATFTVEDTTEPVITCPVNVTVPADAGGCSAFVDPGTATATDVCDLSPVITAERSDSLPLTDPYPLGTTTITWTAEDACGNEAMCDQLITVESSSEMAVTVELEWEFDGTRCITFDLWHCGSPTPVVVSAELTFTDGLATDIIEVPCGEYECITARDTLHTLRSTADTFEIVGTQYVAEFVGADKLIGGNLNDDQWVDILDFGVYSWQFGENYGSGDTDCATTAYPHADIDGDGQVASGDFTFIQINFLAAHEANCCSASGLRLSKAEVGPRTEVSTTELREMGLGHLDVADLNADGWVDQSDIAAFIMGARPEPKPHKPTPNPAAKRQADLYGSR